MMPPLTTSVPVPHMPFRIDFATGIVSLGSCFADEIGKRLRDGDFYVELNPFGTLYNPASIAAALHRLIDDREITADDLVFQDDLFHSWHHHGSFSRPTPEETLEACNGRIHQAHQALGSAKLLMVTFGSAWVFEHEGQVVANCHKVPQQEFLRRRLSVDDIVALWRPLLDELHALYPQLTVLFSVSPIRHMADGLHGNQLSKSTLLLAIDELVTHYSSLITHHSSLVYYPAYELVLDELRDYRYFGPDMCHPSDLAVEIVWEHFQRATMVGAVRQQAQFNRKQHKQERHIPLHPQADNQQ